MFALGLYKAEIAFRNTAVLLASDKQWSEVPSLNSAPQAPAALR